MGLEGIRLGSMGLDGTRWGSMGLYGVRWGSMGRCGMGFCQADYKNLYILIGYSYRV